jgi:hypothetical protein
MADHEGELELELEQVFHEGELEDEAAGSLEGEGWLGALGNIAGSLLGEEEGELEDEMELEDESELELEDELESEEEMEDEYEDEAEGEGWLGTIGNIAGSLLGEEEMEGEDETEEFFGKIGKFLKRAAPMLKKVASVAAPLVGTAIGGHFGGMLGKAAVSALGEEEGEYEEEEEGEEEMVHEIVSQPVTHNAAVAEMMAEAASHASGEGEAEAMSGASTVTVISARDRRALRRILPHLVKGTAVLTRVLRRRRATKPLVRAVPTVVRRTIKDLKRQAAKGVPITRRTAARAAARQVRKVLGSPKTCRAAVVRNLRVSRAYKRRRGLRVGMGHRALRRRRRIR